jgi:hypothetical protein
VKTPLPLLATLGVAACGATEPRFPLREPLAVDTDLRAVAVPCRTAPTDKDPGHLSCAPEEYVSPLIWDGVDNLLFRPFAELWGFEAKGEAANVNSMDEVADSAWFTNRIGKRALSAAEIRRGACEPSQVLDTENVPDGSWVIDKGKDNGSSPGFRVKIPGKGKYMLKSDAPVPERPSAASVVGAAAYHAVGFNFSCEQIVYVKRSAFKLTPGLTITDNTEQVRPFDRAALEQVLRSVSRRGDYYRFQASAWLDGRLLGPFRYEKTRDDDPNDVIPHEDRRELRGGRLLAAWLDHFDAREQNSMDSWFAERKDQPDSSPGHVVHYYLDTSDCFGSEWDWEPISRRLGYSYVVDWADIGRDFVTLGIPLRPWDTVEHQPGREIFGFFDAEHFVPDEWKNEYPNRAFSRMTEADGAWMARILARFTPDLVATLASMAEFSNPANTTYLAAVLEARLEKILERYLTRLSPLTDVHVEGGGSLCATDLAARRHVRGPDAFRFGAWDDHERPLPAVAKDEASFCVSLPHVARDGGPGDDHPSRYVRVALGDGVAPGRLLAYLYDLGPARGYRLAGLRRPEP